jgi:hypothetical protein
MAENCLSVGIILAFIIMLTFASVAYAEELNIRSIPAKLAENSKGKIQVFVTEGDSTIPKKIDGLSITSSDSNILHVEEIVNGDSFITEAAIKAGKAGTTTLYAAAPGFTSKEFPITIYGNKNNAATLLVKITPDTFTTNGPNEGYISVELADEDGFPVIAKEDTTILLNTPNNDVVELSNQNIMIKKGEYFAYTNFHIKNSGEAVLYASAAGIKTESGTIIVNEDDNLTVELYAYPKTLSIHDAAKGFIIVQIHDSSGRPVIAQKDITVFYKITDSSYSVVTNYSTNYKQKTEGYFQISKGSYWGYTQYALPSSIEDTYTISVSSTDPFVVDSDQVVTEDLELVDDKFVKFDTLPVLSTGRSELIGIVYLEDANGDPVVAKRDLGIKIDSSDPTSLSVDEVIVPAGDQVTLVYGRVSHSLPSDLQLRPADNESEVESITVFGPDKDSLDLVAEPLITSVLANTAFPMILYLEDSGETSSFAEDHNVVLSPNEHIEIQPTQIKQGDTLVIVDSISLKDGLASISVEVGDFEDLPVIDSLSAEAAMLDLDYSKTIFVGTNDVFTVQLLNSDGSPTYATDDIDISIVAKEQGMLELPSKVTIAKGSYYTTFDVAPKAVGQTEISFISESLPLLKEEIATTSLGPQLSITGPDTVSAADMFTTTVLASSGERPLVDMTIQWNVIGGIVHFANSKTDSTGQATITVIPKDSIVNIEAIVSGGWFTPTSTTKMISVIPLTSTIEQPAPPNYKPLEIFGIDPILFIVPSAIGAAGFMLKKKGQLTIKK